MFFFNRNTVQYPGENVPYEEQVRKLKEKIQNVEAIVLGVGSGLSTAAGFTYSGERFQKYFFDFAKKYPIQDIYSGGFFPFESPEEFWAWWSRHIYFNRYVDAPSDVYGNLKKIMEGKDYFVLTTNVDHQFQRAGFEKDSFTPREITDFFKAPALHWLRPMTIRKLWRKCWMPRVLSGTMRGFISCRRIRS